MKMMLVCETDKEREFVSRVFDKMMEDFADFGRAESSFLEGGICYHEDDNTDIYPAEAPIVYSLEKNGTYTIYNFKTAKKTENVEGDLAGLANLPEEDFPTL